MLDKHSQFTNTFHEVNGKVPLIVWTANGPVRVTRRPVHLSLWQRFLKWLEG